MHFNPYLIYPSHLGRLEHHREASEENPRDHRFSAPFNESQQRAIVSVLYPQRSPPTPSIAVIHGPPGNYC